MENKPFITPDEFEKMFGIAKNTQVNLRSQKKIPYIKFGGKVLYDVQKLVEFFRTFAVEAH